jgi:hypothetical protein
VGGLTPFGEAGVVVVKVVWKMVGRFVVDCGNGVEASGLVCAAIRCLWR